MKPIGLYVHIPYCAKKCGYCDFYSVCDMSTTEAYTQAVCRSINEYDFEADTLYIGGGTPSQMTAPQLCRIIDTAQRKLVQGAEITIEMNPGDRLERLLPELKSAGVNRISIGMQSATDSQLKKLDRRHNFEQVRSAVDAVRRNGIENLSLDLMLGIEGQTESTVDTALDYIFAEGIPHLSAYMLKIEKATPFYKQRAQRKFPDDEAQAHLYEYLSRILTGRGYEHYEISNYCLDGYRSRHNMKYWRCEEYLGIGASAHSYYKGKRFYYPRNLQSFIEDPLTVPDGEGGGDEEYIMLNLRLKDGVKFAHLPDSLAQKLKAKCACLGDYVVCDEERLVLSEKGFLVSNAIIVELLS